MNTNYSQTIKWLFVFGCIMLLLFVGYVLYYQNRANNQSVLTASLTPIPTHTLQNSTVYPNPTYTPGDVFPSVSVQEICTHGYTQRVRNVSVEEKRQVYEEYGLSYPQPKGAYEVDHFIALELGGSNDIKNLWPEPAEPTPGFHEKDIVENYLHYQVCSGKESLQQAQEEIRSDWYAVYQRIPNPENFRIH